MRSWHPERVRWAAEECPEALERLLRDAGGELAVQEYLEHVVEAVAEGRDEAAIRASAFEPVMERYAPRPPTVRQVAMAEYESDREWERWAESPGDFHRLEIQHSCGGEVYRIPLPDSQDVDICGQCGEHVSAAEVLDRLEEQAKRGLEHQRRAERVENRKQLPAEVPF